MKKLLALGLAFALSIAPALAASKLKNDLEVTGNVTVGGTLGVTGAVTFTDPLDKASLGSQSKRVIFNVPINTGGTLADSTTYRGFVAPGRAGTVTNISVIAGTVPVGGTNTVKVLKGSSAGNTMFSAASYNPTGLTANQAAPMTLTGTATDLAITASGANSGIYVEWATGVQTTDAVNAAVSIEFEPDDY